ncbi:MAK10-like protein, partial [Tanacetum coccineum]
MGDENPIHTIGDYSKPSHDGYKNNIELPVGNNVVPFRFDTIRTVKLRNDILMFQQHHEESLSEAWTHGGKLRDRNAKESWALLKDLALYDNESWNDPRDFIKPVKAITLPQDVPSTSDRHLIELENKVQRLMEAHLSLTHLTQVNKVTTLYEICSGPHDTQYCMEDPEQAFVEYASLRTDEAGGSINTITIHSKKPSDSYDEKAKENKEEEKDNPKISMSTPPHRPICQLHSSLKKSSNSIRSSNRSDWFLNHPTPSEGELEEKGNTTTERLGAEYFDIFPTKSELAYHKKLDLGKTRRTTFGTTAIIDTGASACCINNKVIPKEALEPLTQTVVFNGLSSKQQATQRIKQGYFLIEENKFKIPLVYAFDMRDINGIEMLIGANFLRSMKGGIRIEGDEITIYKK